MRRWSFPGESGGLKYQKAVAYLPLLLIPGLIFGQWLSRRAMERKAPSLPPAYVPIPPSNAAPSASLGDGGPALQARLENPVAVAVGPRGDLFIVDGPRIRWVDVDGVISTIAGGGERSFLGEGEPASRAKFEDPSDIVLDRAGDLYVADRYCVRKITPSGVIRTVAGGGFSLQEGVPARQAALLNPVSIAIGPRGDLYVADTGTHLVRRVGRDGRIVTVAGGGKSLGDGEPATDARLIFPCGVAADDLGNLYVADRGDHRLRKVTPDGRISTIAGIGTRGISVEEMPARKARLNGPLRVETDADGNVYIVSVGIHMIRKITPDGEIKNVAGTGLGGYGADGVPATRSLLNGPHGIALDEKGDLYIADTYNGRIRKVNAKGIVTTVAGAETEEK
jgi:DNA-binding beta-propeller fold protein YncE